MANEHPGFRILVLGAGFSRLAGLPLGKELFADVQKSCNYPLDEAPRWQHCTGMGGLRRFVIGAGCEIAIFAAGLGIAMTWPDASPTVWFVVAILGLLVAGIAWKWPAIAPRLPKWTRKEPQEKTAVSQTKSDNGWINEDEAIGLIMASSLVLLRLPNETVTLGEALLRRQGLITTPTGSSIRANEIARHLLKTYNDECSWGKRDGMYFKEYLEDWIGEKAYQDHSATSSL